MQSAQQFSDLTERPVVKAPSSSYERRARRFRRAFQAGATCVLALQKVLQGAPGLDSPGEQKVETENAPQHIQLKVGGHDQLFKIKKSTPLRKLMNVYCSRLGLQASRVCFTVEGKSIAEDDTAEKLGLENDDLIEVTHFPAVVVPSLFGVPDTFADPEFNQVASTTGAADGSAGGMLSEVPREKTSQKTGGFQPFEPTASTGGARSGEQQASSSEGQSLDGGYTSGQQQQQHVPLSSELEAPTSLTPDSQVPEFLAGIHTAGAMVFGDEESRTLLEEVGDHGSDDATTCPNAAFLEALAELSAGKQEEGGWVNFGSVVSLLGQSWTIRETVEIIQNYEFEDEVEDKLSRTISACKSKLDELHDQARCGGRHAKSSQDHFRRIISACKSYMIRLIAANIMRNLAIGGVVYVNEDRIRLSNCESEMRVMRSFSSERNEL